jgi:M6 family metalloprotease-like protein
MPPIRTAHPHRAALRTFGLSFGLLLALGGFAAVMSSASARLPRDARPEDRGRPAPAPQDVLTGRLELIWGDAPPGPDGRPLEPHVLRAHLVEDDGRRRTLDSGRALVAANDLYSLFGRRIAVGVAPSAAKTRGPNALGADAAASEVLVPDAIVPIEDLISPGPAQRRAKSAAAAQSVFETQAVAGTTTWVTLMCKFSDQAAEPKPLSFFQSQYGTAVGQLGHYWQEVSYGQINLSGSNAYGWATLPEPRSSYITFDTATNKDKADLGKLFRDCTAAHDANVNYAVNGGVQGVNMMFNDNLDGSAWGGGQCGTLDGINKCWSTTWNPPWSFNNLAPLSHEMGHAYGLPHANNSDTDSDTYDNVWDVMSDSWNNAVSSTTFGALPKHINMYSRNRLGWVASARKRTINAGSGASQIVLDRASLAGSTNTQMIVLAYPGQTTRYYVLETRRRVGSYENRLPGDAVIVHEVQTSRKEPSWSVDADQPPANRSNNEGSMFKVGETWTSPDFAFRVKVEAATAEGFVVTVKPAPARPRPTPSRRAASKPAELSPSVLAAVSARPSVAPQSRLSQPQR